MSESDSPTTVTGDEAGQAEREKLLARTFVRLADTMVEDFDVVDFLHGLSSDAVRVLGAQAAGVMLGDGRGILRLVASSEERMRLLELFELQSAEGPCLDAYRTGAAVQADSNEARRLWPHFAEAAADVGFRLMCAVPLQLRGRVIGALNVFRDSNQAFTGTELTVAKAMAEVASIGLLQQRALTDERLLAEQLQTALQSRVVIEQAKGMVAQYLNISIDDAFTVIRRFARDHNLQLTRVAHQVADRQLTGDAFREKLA